MLHDVDIQYERCEKKDTDDEDMRMRNERNLKESNS